ncbi:MAG: methyltransferase [Candidatus Latescibacterota bacterium]|nr:methyltransferase [Candidatus Latescibacterota bacterium]
MATHPIYVTSFKGLGVLTLRELRNRFGINKAKVERGFVRDYEINRFAMDHTDDIGTLRTTEDVFYELGTANLTGQRGDETLIENLISVAPIEEAIGCKRAFTPKSRPGAPTFRVIIQADDAPWRRYRRERLEQAAVKAISLRYRKWRRVEDDSLVEIWIQLIDQTALIGMRLTDRTMRHRDYKTANLPGSLRPTIAAAAVLLSKPTDTDIFLDPNCGAGTILLERALDRPYQNLLGGDIRQEALDATRENFGNRHKPCKFRTWDATSLPLGDGSVNRVVTNPPWGRQVSAGQNVTEYYKQFLLETQRVLSPWGKAIILTSEWRAMQNGLKTCQALKIGEQIKGISVMGRKADMFSLIRTHS